jgi:hypothetical protein
LLLWLIKKIRKIKNSCYDKRSNRIRIYTRCQSELHKSDDNMIKRTSFIFDRDTDIGKIQIEDILHACISSNDLYPSKGVEYEIYSPIISK